MKEVNLMSGCVELCLLPQLAAAEPFGYIYEDDAVECENTL